MEITVSRAKAEDKYQVTVVFRLAPQEQSSLKRHATPKLLGLLAKFSNPPMTDIEHLNVHAVVFNSSATADNFIADLESELEVATAVARASRDFIAREPETKVYSFGIPGVGVDVKDTEIHNPDYLFEDWRG